MNTYVPKKTKRNFDTLMDAEKAWLKHCMTGQIRNLLANEFEVPAGKSAGQEVAQFLERDAPKHVKRVLQEEMDRIFDDKMESNLSKAIRKMIMEEVRAAIQKQIIEHIGPRIKEAADNFTMGITTNFDSYEGDSKPLGRF